MKQIVIASTLCIIFIANIATGLVCQYCQDDCEHPDIEECLEPGENQQIACLRETFKGTQNSTTLDGRRCVIYMKEFTEFECVSPPGYNLTSCEICNTDLCNKGSKEFRPKNALGLLNRINNDLAKH